MIPGANIRHSSILRQPLTVQSTVRPLFVERKTFRWNFFTFWEVFTQIWCGIKWKNQMRAWNELRIKLFMSFISFDPSCSHRFWYFFLTFSGCQALKPAIECSFWETLSILHALVYNESRFVFMLSWLLVNFRYTNCTRKLTFYKNAV